MVVNLRGTHGSGKSTIVRAVLDRCTDVQPVQLAGRKRPLGYRCVTPIGPLWVPGHYETACGGCDTILSVDDVYAMVHAHVAQGFHVLMEGILLGHDVRRCVALQTEHGQQVLVIVLVTDLEICYAAAQQRRTDRGDARPLKTDNVYKGANSYRIHQPKRFLAAGVRVELLDRDPARALVLDTFGLPADSLPSSPVVEQPDSLFAWGDQ